MSGQKNDSNQLFTMKNVFLNLGFSILLLATSSVQAQRSLNAGSGQANLSGQVHQYSIGEMTLVHTARTQSLSLTQGFLQPHRILVESTSGSAPSYTDVLENIKVYPNPTQNLLFIECFANETSTVTYQLFDAAGHLIINKNSMQEKGTDRFTVDLRTFASGTYFLLITKDQPGQKRSTYNYRIQKIN